jgi:hypothetical protein
MWWDPARDFVSGCKSRFRSIVHCLSRNEAKVEIIKPLTRMADQESTKWVPLSPYDYLAPPCAHIDITLVFPGHECMIPSQSCGHSEGNGPHEETRLDMQMLKDALACALTEHPYLAGQVRLDILSSDENKQAEQMMSNHDPETNAGLSMPPYNSQPSEKLRLEYNGRGVKWTTKVSRSKKRTVAKLLPFIEFPNDYSSRNDGKCSMKRACFRLPRMTPYYYEVIRDATSFWKCGEYPMRIQATELIDGSVIIVVSVTHLLTDLQPLKIFFQAWSKYYTLIAAANGPEEREDALQRVRHRVFEPSTVQKYHLEKGKRILDSIRADVDLMDDISVLSLLGQDRIHSVSWAVGGKKIFRYPFYLRLIPPSILFDHVSIFVSDLHLSHARHNALEEMNAKHACHDSWLSENDILTALAWKIMARRSTASDDPWGLHLACTMRKRSDPPVPYEAWGNCSDLIHVGYITPSDADQPISLLAEKVRESIRNFCADKFEASLVVATHCILERPGQVPALRNNSSLVSLNPIRPRLPFAVTSWDFSKGFEQEINFAGVRPVWIQPEDMGYGMVCVIMPCSSHIRDAGYMLSLQMYSKKFGKTLPTKSEIATWLGIPTIHK